MAIRIKAELAEAKTKVEAAAQKLVDDMNLHDTLNTLRFTIRNDIAAANQTAGINALMNKREQLKARLQLLSRLTVTELAHGEQELSDLLQSTKSALEQGINYIRNSVHVQTSVVTSGVKNSVTNVVNTVKKDIEDLEDELAQKNLAVKVELKEESIKLLQSVGLM